MNQDNVEMSFQRTAEMIYNTMQGSNKVPPKAGIMLTIISS